MSKQKIAQPKAEPQGTGAPPGGFAADTLDPLNEAIGELQLALEVVVDIDTQSHVASALGLLVTAKRNAEGIDAAVVAQAGAK
jgi:hypothetical protein